MYSLLCKVFFFFFKCLVSVTQDSPVPFEDDDEEEEGGSLYLIVRRDITVRVGPIYSRSLDMGQRKGREWERAGWRGKGKRREWKKRENQSGRQPRVPAAMPPSGAPRGRRLSSHPRCLPRFSPQHHNLGSGVMPRLQRRP